MKNALCWLMVGSLLVLLAGVAEAQEQRDVDRGDGTVEDTRTGLIWLADADCLDPMPWAQAKAEAGKLEAGRCGLTDGSEPGDWRLPTQDEWELMVQCSCGPASPTASLPAWPVRGSSETQQAAGAAASGPELACRRARIR